MINEMNFPGANFSGALVELVNNPARSLADNELDKFQTGGLDRLALFVQKTPGFAEQLKTAKLETLLTDDHSEFGHTMSKETFLGLLHRATEDNDIKALTTVDGAATWKQAKLDEYGVKLDWLTTAARTLSGLAAKLTQTA